MAAVNSKDNLSTKTFEHEWVIENWLNVIKDETLLNNTTTEIQCEEAMLEYANFLVGLKICSIGQNRYTKFYWELTRKHINLHNVEAKLNILTLKNDGTRWRKHESQASAVLGTAIDINGNGWNFPSLWEPGDVVNYTNFDGSLKIKLKLTLTNLPDVYLYSKAEFQKTSRDEVCQNLADMLDDNLSSDVTIVTNDKTNLLAHKAILRARCPVFASMLGSDFLEGSSDEVIVDDVGAKTMQILLKYWYSGELLPSWRDDDIIVEFIYATGKYQITKVLNMLDDFLGLELKASEVTVELLRMVQNLGLKNAEAKLLTHIIHKISQVTSGSELLDLVSSEANNLEEKSILTSKILKEIDDVFSKEHYTDACSTDVKLMAFACKFEMKNVEKRLFKRIVSRVNKIGSVNELFALFSLDNEQEDDDSKESDLLVRANQEQGYMGFSKFLLS